jgi:hypothetical protein
MKQTTRRATHLLGLALALAVFAGGIVPPGRAQQRAKTAQQDAARLQQPQQQSSSKTNPTETAAATQVSIRATTSTSAPFRRSRRARSLSPATAPVTSIFTSWTRTAAASSG